jgi:hypothetical protein
MRRIVDEDGDYEDECPILREGARLQEAFDEQCRAAKEAQEAARMNAENHVRTIWALSESDGPVTIEWSDYFDNDRECGG